MSDTILALLGFATVIAVIVLAATVVLNLIFF